LGAWQQHRSLQISLVAAHIHKTVICLAAASILSIKLQLLHADRLFLMTLLLAFMVAGHKEFTVGYSQPYSSSCVSRETTRLVTAFPKLHSACMSPQSQQLHEAEAAPWTTIDIYGSDLACVLP
jgi:hypothetical protein